jgi:hypothetical protein
LWAGRDAIGDTAAGEALTPAASTQGAWPDSRDGMFRVVAMTADAVNSRFTSTFALMLRTRSLGPEPAVPTALGRRVLRLDGRDIYWDDAPDAPGFSVYVVAPNPTHTLPSHRRRGRR